MKYFIKWEYWNVNEYFYRDVCHPGGLQLQTEDIIMTIVDTSISRYTFITVFGSLDERPKDTK